MDGFIDLSDAFFSYKDRAKRLEILDDPRVGAFGVMAVVFLVVGKIIIVAEVLSFDSFHWIFLYAYPFFFTRNVNCFICDNEKCKRRVDLHISLKRR